MEGTREGVVELIWTEVRRWEVDTSDLWSTSGKGVALLASFLSTVNLCITVFGRLFRYYSIIVHHHMVVIIKDYCLLLHLSSEHIASNHAWCRYNQCLL